MKRRIIALVGLTTLLILVLSSCQYLSFINPAWALQGNWDVTTRPDDWDDQVQEIVFSPGAESYQWLSAAGDVIHTATITNLTSSTFTSTQTEGGDSGTSWYQYSLADGRNELTLTLYANADLSGYSATLVATRQ